MMVQRRIIFFTVTLVMGLLAGVSSIRAEPEPKAPVDAPRADDPGAKWQRIFRDMAGDYDIVANDETARESELRLLAQPLYRYELKDHPDLQDGAILSFVQGTDPEILMILEARRDGADSFWQYALARFSDRGLAVKHKDKEVWRVGGSIQNDNQAPDFIRSV